jgi:hypothetical protein
MFGNAGQSARLAGLIVVDAMELKKVAGEKGSMAEKAKEAAAALKDPGAPGDPTTPPAERPPTA